ncbi:MAG: hypothetical protein FJ272_11445, partial [Planctomycetes bacterium]|nr:hypothetical protein [Planctomycetota bacterium]
MRMNPVFASALALLAAATALAQDAGLDRNLDVIHKPAAVSVGFRDIDLVKARFPALRAAVSLLDAQGRAVESCAVDFAHEATPSHVVFRKDGRSVYATVSVRVSDGDRVLMEKSVALPRPVESMVAPQLAETAHLEPGTAFDAGSAPTVPLLDLARVQAATLAEPAREVAAEACKRRVVAELNFPSASGTALISRQTAAPDDPARRSFYIPCSSELYDPATGAYESTLKYLIEIPIDPAWLATGGDAAVQASPDDIRVHITADKINVTRQGERRLTGQEKGLLGQTVNSCGVADDGSLYFALQYAGPIRFNVRKAKWEAPPVNLYEWLEARLPKPEDLPYPKGEVTDVRIDPSYCIYAFNGRVYLLPTRYMQVGKTSSGGNSLFNAAVLSIPMEHWDDKDAFANAIRLNAVSWPGTPISLWSTHVERNDHQRKLNLMMPAGNRLLFTAYHYNYFWILDLADDGSTRRLTPAPTFAGKRIAQIAHGGHWLQRGADILGIQMQITLEGEPKPRDVFLAMDATEFTDQIPKQCQRLLHYQFSGQIPIVENKESSYGCYLALKRSVQHALGLPRADGLLSIYYDALGRMKKHPGPHRELIDRMSAASMGPEYYLVPAPGAMEILGTSDYPIYNFARYDCSAAATVSRKTHLFRKAAGLDVRLNAPARLGLYCHQWFREGGDDMLYYAGYTGIARLRYRVQGRVPEFHEPELLRYKLKQESLDGSPMGEL